MERNVHIPIPDSELEIQGVLRGDYTSPLAILAPGLGSWKHDLLLFNASRFFEQQGIATLRVSFCDDDNKQRNIGDFGVKINAEDIDIVVDHAREQGSDWVCVIGHSYSGMAIVYSTKQAFDAAVLWDASHTDGYDEPQAKKNLENDFLYIKELDSYVSVNGPGYVLSRKVFEDYAPGSTAMAQAFKIDTLIVNASDSGEAMYRFGEDYAANIDAVTEHIVIPDTYHPFTEDGAMENLYVATVKWIKGKLAEIS
ncbi:hypothetical protein BH23PAT2_BH23PAT2_05170 [soil metagenome]